MSLRKVEHNDKNNNNLNIDYIFNIDNNTKSSILKLPVKKMEFKSDKKLGVNKKIGETFLAPFSNKLNTFNLINGSFQKLPSYNYEKYDKKEILDIVNNNMKYNLNINGTNINGNNFVQDFLQNEIKRNKSLKVKNTISN